MKKSILLIFCFILLSVYNIYSQEEHSIFLDIYYNLIESNKKDSARNLTINYLKKFKHQNKISEDYLDLYMLLSETDDFDTAILYLDTLISLSKSLEKKHHYPATAYYEKGSKYYDKKNFVKALDNYLLAFNEAKKHKNKYLEIISLHNLGLLKLERAGSEREAIKIFKKCEKFYEKDDNITTYPIDYLILIYSYSEAYRNIKKLDSSLYYNKFGLSESLRLNTNHIKDYFIFSEGINESIRGNFEASLDSLKWSKKSLIENNDIGNIILSNYYFGKSYLGLNNNVKALEHFKKIDTLFTKNLIYIPEIRLAYTYLKNNAIRNNELKEGIRYIEKIQKLDSLFINNFKIINNTFKDEFNNKELQEEKYNLEKQLKDKNSKSIYKSYLLIFLFIAVLSIYYFLNKKNKYYKKKFIKIVDNIDSTQVAIKNNQSKELKISEEIVSKCLNSLDKFEKENGFLKPNLTTYNLSKIVGVNTKYLTKIIKVKKERTFPNYINELRIRHAIKKLKDDPVFIKYTISSIAKEVGFSNTISFSQAFKKYTNLNPSFFIQEMIRSKES
ncbi:MAG: AraC family transcriptional regulator [Flavobacteriaceae bacterium]|nr:AraC family transcriptional regulator [Flavobacteriaceae bacterium]